MYDVRNEPNFIAVLFVIAKYWKLHVMFKCRRLIEQTVVHSHIQTDTWVSTLTSFFPISPCPHIYQVLLLLPTTPSHHSLSTTLAQVTIISRLVSLVPFLTPLYNSLHSC